jgi:hypothetical protein
MVAVLLVQPVEAASAPHQAFRPVLPRLQHAKVPVYLPHWLPPLSRKVYPFSSMNVIRNVRGPGTSMHMYEVDLSVDRHAPCNACNTFFITGSDGDIEITPQTHPVSLGGGRWGFVSLYQGTLRQQFQWYIGKYAYAMRCACTDAQYRRIALSAVRVH